MWQLDGPAQAALAQATQVYAGLKLWPAEVTARLVEAQLVADGTYPNAAAVFADSGTAAVGDAAMADAPWAGGGSLHYLTEPRNRIGEWSEGEGGPDRLVTLAGFHHERERRRRRARRLKRQARKRDKPAEERGGSGEPEGPGPDPEEKRSAPPADKPEGSSSTSVMPPSSLPDTERDGFELPAGVTPQEARELQLNGSPIGISFEVQGRNTTALGKSYSDAVNVYRGAQEAPSARELGDLEPDGILASRDPDGELGVEAKYIEDWSESLYNPDLRRAFPHNEVQNTVDQALKYAKGYPAGVEWYTNSLDFVRTYSQRFKKAGIKNFTFTIIPASRTKL